MSALRFARHCLIASLLVTISASAQVRVNEFMASNDSTIVPNAVAGKFNDWIELHNESATPVDLGGWHLTDNATNPVKWTFPANTVIPASGYRIVFASSTNAPDANGNLHTNFSLNTGGEYLALAQPGGVVVSEFETGGVDFPPQEADVSYGRKPGDLSSVYFATATPGAPNAADGYLRVAAIQPSQKRGLYTTAFNVTLTTATPGAVIYYTLNSSPPLQANGTPAAGATVYAAPIPITTTTILRSAAVKTGHEPTLIDSQSYLFPAAVATQTRPASYPTTWGGSITADYAVDPAVSQSTADATRFQAGLRSIPTLSVTATMDSLFGTSGIYTLSTNDLIEAAASAEYFKPAASGEGVNVEAGFQIDCALKVQGGASRNHASSAKHSFSLRFREIYGPAKLDYDLFGAPAVDRFNSVQLRAMYNNSWTHGDANQRARADLIRDQWMRDSLLAMGQPDGGHGKYVNLYLNGLFWGVYNLHERLDNNHYAAYQEGVEDETVFSYNPGAFTTEENTSLNLMKTAVTSGVWADIEARLDVDSYIDYYIMQHFGHNDDLKTNGNWRAAGGGTGLHQWRFYLWDSERTMENPASVNNLAVSQDGVAIIAGLDHLPEFQARFADRAWKHLTNGGALVNDRNRARYQLRVTELDDAITGESARWGDWRTTGGGGPSGDYTRINNWLPALNGPLSTNPTGGILGTSNSWFPASGTTHRTNTMLTAWKTQVWEGTTVTRLPNVDPPAFTVNHTAQHGGFIPSGGVLRLTGGTGTLYVTTDGSDPRLTGGTVKPGLTAYPAGSAISLTVSSTVRTRWFNGTRWSALNEAAFFVEPLATAASTLRISEIHYHPETPSPLEVIAGAALPLPRRFVADDFQFIEILNAGTTAVNLSGSQLAGGVSFTFGNVPLAPGARIVVAENSAAFTTRYGPGIVPAGTWSGALARNGETISLSAPESPITSVTYSDATPWPSRAEGDGSSLELINPAGLTSDAANWRSSFTFHGSPGTAGPDTAGPILVNEVLAHTDPPLRDSIELVNPTTTAVDVSGWFLSDSKSNYRKFRIPDGTVIPAGGYRVFDETHFNAPTPSAVTGYNGTPGAAPVTVTSPAHGLTTGDAITLSGYGGYSLYNGSWQVTVTGPDTFTLPTVFLDDHTAKGTWTRGAPFALDAARGEDVWLLQGTTGGELLRFSDHVAFPASLNAESFGRWPDASGPLTPQLNRTLGTINAGPRVGPLLISEIMVQPNDSPETEFEFVEIWNPGDTVQNLANWTLRGAVDYNFTGQNIPAGGRLVVVGFDPADVAKSNAFRNRWNVTAPVLAGPWTSGNTLTNGSGTVRLRRSDEPPVEEPLLFPQVIEDEVFYNTTAPWPVAATPGSQSLNRTGLTSFGSDATSWTAASATPGQPAPGFESWATSNTVSGGPFGDSDLDRIPNLLEYALNLLPGQSDVQSLPQPVLSGSTLNYTWQKLLARPDVALVAQMSTDLSTWTNLPDTIINTADGAETRRATIDISGKTRVFMRLRALR